MALDHGTNTLPVTIITGFLGSGKTTLLNRLLRHPELADTAVIVNEFGAVGLDHLLMEPAIEDAVLLANGCICCTVRGDIADTLDLLWERRASGALPPFRRIAIETTGLADPAPVAHALLAGPEARFACRLDGIVTTVDALHGAAQLARQGEARAQVALADRILLTKTDLADPEAIAAAEAAIAGLNPGAPIRHVLAGAADPADVFDLGPEAGRIAVWLGAGAHAGHGHLPFRHGPQIAATVLRSDRPIAWERAALWLDSLLSLQGNNVLRVKGVVRIPGEDRSIVVQAVHHVPHPPAFLAGPAAAAMGTRIVVIARGLSAAGLRASFAAATE
jgi:G3E family GTPase